jgi:ferredoxin
MAPNDVLEPEDRRAGLILACQSRPLSEEVLIEF